MKGVILAGGKGTRLRPLTNTLNKMMLPVYDKPMIFYPIMRMAEVGITEICIVINRNSGEIISALGSGKSFGVEITYVVQENPKGIVHALQKAEKFVGRDDFCLVLGDNLFSTEDLRNGLELYTGYPMVFLKRVENPKEFGVAVLDEGKIVGVVEKPTEFISDIAITGIYVYPYEVFKLCEQVSPSYRGEYEITDVNRMCVDKGILRYYEMQDYYLDTGNPTSLLKAGNIIEQRQGID